MSSPMLNRGLGYGAIGACFVGVGYLGPFGGEASPWPLVALGTVMVFAAGAYWASTAAIAMMEHEQERPEDGGDGEWA